ncbi:hypothetical protein OPT61_g8402 [Boeremia exigua]|uniref:Uncharacterized protein n=1 Tax=Boeremia exigua TaxID=749465 RepID=A0ACC2HYD8_9PLEO|nr:hypothetical protein OPT61_g8402 [Boeremia exigua]
MTTAMSKQGTVVEQKQFFLQAKKHHLSRAIIPSQRLRTIAEDGGIELSVVKSALDKVNRDLKQHSRKVYSRQMIDHIVNQIDELYWELGAQDVDDEEEEAPEEDSNIVYQNENLTIDENIAKLPNVWDSSADPAPSRDVDQDDYTAALARLQDLSAQRLSLQTKLTTHRTLLALLEPYRKPKENIQPNLVWRDAPLAPELAKTRTLAIRVAGRVGEKLGDVQAGEGAAQNQDPSRGGRARLSGTGSGRDRSCRRIEAAGTAMHQYFQARSICFRSPKQHSSLDPTLPAIFRLLSPFVNMGSNSPPSSSIGRLQTMPTPKASYGMPTGSSNVNKRGNRLVDRFSQHRVTKKQKRQHARMLARHSDDRRSLSPLRRMIVPNLMAGSGAPKSPRSGVPIDAIRKLLKMTKISNKTPPSLDTSDPTPPQPQCTQMRKRASSDPGRYGAFEVLSTNKYHVPRANTADGRPADSRDQRLHRNQELKCRTGHQQETRGRSTLQKRNGPRANRDARHPAAPPATSAQISSA